ncbi:hypothetical protein PAEAM_27340 [Paenibacillus sp. GM1FR]|nr:hypothetical protein PAEAM_27340 [Paenibacillus sp. GM1FR]
MLQVQIKHQCAMTEHAPTCGKLGVARNFLFADLQIITPGQLGIYTKLVQSFNHRLGELAEIVEGLTVIRCNKAEIQVAQIVIYRAASRKTTNHLHTVILNVLDINFFNRILMFSDDNRRTVNVEQQIAVILHRQMFQNVLLNGKVYRRICNALVVYKQHGHSSINVCEGLLVPYVVNLIYQKEPKFLFYCKRIMVGTQRKQD